MRWLLACNKSGYLRELLRAKGHDAWTNDIEPAEDGSPYHIRADAREVAWSVNPAVTPVPIAAPCEMNAGVEVESFHVGRTKQIQVRIV